MNKVTRYRGYRDAIVGLPSSVLPFDKDIWALKCQTGPNLNVTVIPVTSSTYDISFRKFNNLTASLPYLYSIKSSCQDIFEAEVVHSKCTAQSHMTAALAADTHWSTVVLTLPYRPSHVLRSTLQEVFFENPWHKVIGA